MPFMGPAISGNNNILFYSILFDSVRLVFTYCTFLEYAYYKFSLNFTSSLEFILFQSYGTLTFKFKIYVFFINHTSSKIAPVCLDEPSAPSFCANISFLIHCDRVIKTIQTSYFLLQGMNMSVYFLFKAFDFVIFFL